MHESVYKFAASVVAPETITGKDVLEVGSRDENGSLRTGWEPFYPALEALKPASWLGVDVRPGPGVDRVQAAEDCDPDSADFVVCTEMLEHAADWRGAMRGMVSALRVGGTLLLTTRSPGFPYHPFPEDHWRYPVKTMGEILNAFRLDVLRLEPDWEPAHPGVFVLARKTVAGLTPSLSDIHPVPVLEGQSR